MRTQGAFYADSDHQGGLIWFSALDLAGAFLGSTISANQVLTRNALGDYSFNRTAAGGEAYIFACPITDLKRLIESPNAPLPFQEQFGAAAGTAGYPASVAGMPPFTGASQLTPPTGMPAKGIKITDVVASYQVGVAALTAASFSLNRTVYVNNVANAVTNMPVSATALPTATQANPYTVVRAVTTPAYETTDNSQVVLELALTMQNLGTLRVNGMGVHVSFNFD